MNGQTEIDILLFCRSDFYRDLTFPVNLAENLALFPANIFFLTLFQRYRHLSVFYRLKQQGTREQFSYNEVCQHRWGERLTPALELGYKYYYSILRCYSQVWNLTPALTDDLASMSHHLHSDSKPVAWRVRGWCRGSDTSLTTFFSSSEGWPSSAACGQISNICSWDPPPSCSNKMSRERASSPVLSAWQPVSRRSKCQAVNFTDIPEISTKW